MKSLAELNRSEDNEEKWWARILAEEDGPDAQSARLNLVAGTSSHSLVNLDTVEAVNNSASVPRTSAINIQELQAFGQEPPQVRVEESTRELKATESRTELGETSTADAASLRKARPVSSQVSNQNRQRMQALATRKSQGDTA